jgi:hypothetical protein
MVSMRPFAQASVGVFHCAREYTPCMGSSGRPCARPPPYAAVQRRRVEYSRRAIEYVWSGGPGSVAIEALTVKAPAGRNENDDRAK